jgi:hypothetical protein
MRYSCTKISFKLFSLELLLSTQSLCLKKVLYLLQGITRTAIVTKNHCKTCFKEILSKLFLDSQANEILSSFDDRLRIYATKQLTKVRDA